MATSVIWGTRGSNGVIVLTTKHGRSVNGKFTASIRSSISIGKINHRMPLQTGYGQGLNGLYSNTSSASWGDLISARSGGTDT